jgi:eukaryotic-like serine/threonine-protein kinase
MTASRVTVDLPDRYRPVRHIANGGMASVWAAEDTVLRREVAINVLSPHLTDSDGAVRRFKREARAAAGLSANPHVATIYDVGEHDGRPFIVMEQFSGGTVADRLREGKRPSPEEAVRWLRGTATALDAAHERGIVHRDVKPGNMLFDDQGEVALADFGIARVAYDPSVTSTGEILGTAAYISPEQADGKTATAASDVYALAVVAFELLTGTRPFSTQNFAATARQHVEQPPPRASERNEALTPEIDDVLERGMAKDPGARWPTAMALADALDRAVAAMDEEPEPDSTMVMPGREAPALRPRPPFGPPRPPTRDRTDDDEPARRRRPPVALLIVGLALAALLIGTIGLLAGGGDDGGPQQASSSKAERDARAKQRERERQRRLQGQTPATQAPQPQEKPSQTQPAPSDNGSGGSAGGDPAALNDQGFGLMNQGRYDEAIPVLQQAVQACGNSVSDLTCAYATFNLAKALRLAGRPAEAIPLLERRLQNPDQRGEVEAELAAARAAAGQGGDSGVDQGPGRGAGKPGKGPKKPKKGKGGED